MIPETTKMEDNIPSAIFINSVEVAKNTILAVTGDLLNRFFTSFTP